MGLKLYPAGEYQPSVRDQMKHFQWPYDTYREKSAPETAGNEREETEVMTPDNYAIGADHIQRKHRCEMCTDRNESLSMCARRPNSMRDHTILLTVPLPQSGRLPAAACKPVEVLVLHPYIYHPACRFALHSIKPILHIRKPLCQTPASRIEPLIRNQAGSVDDIDTCPDAGHAEHDLAQFACLIMTVDRSIIRHPVRYSLDRVREGNGGIDVLRDDTSRQPVLRAVCPLDNFLQCAKLQDALNRAKDFLTSNLHLIGYVREDGRFDKVPNGSGTFTSGLELGSFRLARFDVTQYLLELFLIYLRTLLNTFLERVAHLALTGHFGSFGDECIVDTVLHERTTSGTAILTMVGEDCIVCNFYRFVNFNKNSSQSIPTITSGLLPPSSSDTFFRLDVDAPFRMMRPVSTDPVNATLRMSGWATIAAPTVGPNPFTTLITPSGNPASFDSAAMCSALSGVCSAGFSTSVQPAARAGAHFQVSIRIG
uniref:Uncharacterized protein n=1 Tax=Anopheles culicifacies TaxID=139723 RepID=A0A182MMK1_9DIPT